MASQPSLGGFVFRNLLIIITGNCIFLAWFRAAQKASPHITSHLTLLSACSNLGVCSSSPPSSPHHLLYLTVSAPAGPSPQQGVRRRWYITRISPWRASGSAGASDSMSCRHGHWGHGPQLPLPHLSAKPGLQRGLISSCDSSNYTPCPSAEFLKSNEPMKWPADCLYRVWQ